MIYKRDEIPTFVLITGCDWRLMCLAQSCFSVSQLLKSLCKHDTLKSWRQLNTKHLSSYFIAALFFFIFLNHKQSRMNTWNNAFRTVIENWNDLIFQVYYTWRFGSKNVHKVGRQLPSWIRRRMKRSCLWKMKGEVWAQLNNRSSRGRFKRTPSYKTETR